MYNFDDLENLKRKNINLSSDAWKIIDLDMNNFMNEKKQLSTFFNIIFTNFYQSADASIYIRTQEYKKELQSLIGNENIIIEKLCNNFLKDLTNRIDENKVKVSSKRLGKDGKFKETKIKLNNFNYDIIKNSLDIQQDYYKQKDRFYLNALFEEYTKLSGFEREKIYFKNYIDMFDIATKISKCKLKVQLINSTDDKPGYSFIFNPCGIYTEDTKSYGYFAGTKDSKEFVFRINRISKMSLEYSDRIDPSALIGLDTKIKDKGIMYLSGELNEYKVSLTKRGIILYNRTLNMRPQVENISDNIYTFNCTEFQFENYFFKFGKECIVISPQSTRDKFINEYKQALSVYTKEDVE